MGFLWELKLGVPHRSLKSKSNLKFESWYFLCVYVDIHGHIQPNLETAISTEATTNLTSCCIFSLGEEVETYQVLNVSLGISFIIM